MHITSASMTGTSHTDIYTPPQPASHPREVASLHLYPGCFAPLKGTPIPIPGPLGGAEASATFCFPSAGLTLDPVTQMSAAGDLSLCLGPQGGSPP